MGLTLVLGGARSGKSARALGMAEAQAAETSAGRVFVATAEALDEEMADRIARHRAERSQAWRTIEAPLDLACALDGCSADDVVLVDCLTLWLSNSMLREDGGHERRVDAMLLALRRRNEPTVVVSNEVGWGVVPDNALARRFRDEAGRLNQVVAAIADRVELVVSGLPLVLKGG